MGVLDDLKKEAEAIAAEKARENTERAAAQAKAREQIDPCMQRVHKYFEELKQHLEVVNREILASYEVRGVGRVDRLVQGQYAVARPNPEKLDRFSFRCVCAKPGVLQVTQSDAASVASFRDYLRDNGMQAKVRDTGRNTALFMVQAAVPVVVEFSADYERAVIMLRVRNLTAMGVSRHTFTAPEVDAKLLDEIAKAILRTENRFDEVVGHSLSNTGKIRLKKKIRAAMRQKQIEDEMAARQAKKEPTLTQRFSRTLFGRKDDS